MALANPRRKRRRTTRRRRRSTRRRRNPTLALAANPRRRRRRSVRRSYSRRRRNPVRIGSVTREIRTMDLTAIGTMAGGFVGNLLGLTMMPDWFKQPVRKYAFLVGAPVLAKVLLKGKLGNNLFTGGIIAAGVHALNDYVIKGRLLPSAIAYYPLGGGGGMTTIGDVGQSYLEPGMGQGDMDLEELELEGLGQGTPEVRDYQSIGQTEEAEIPELDEIEAALGQTDEDADYAVF